VNDNVLGGFVVEQKKVIKKNRKSKIICVCGLVVDVEIISEAS